MNRSNGLDNKLHVVDKFEDAKDASYVPSVEMLKRYLFSKYIQVDCFQYDNGYLYVNNFGIIDGVTYTIEDGNFIVNVDDSTLITSVSMNEEKELEMII